MRYSQALQIIIITSLFISCRKDHTVNPDTPPATGAVKKVLLKDITIPHLPSPYYHFEYNSDSLVTKADFGSGFTIYTVLYNENRIGEMRNNIIVNHDTLRYVYDNAGKVSTIKFINETNLVYRLVSFAYDGSLVTKIDWAHLDNSDRFVTDRTLTFTYHPDGNLQTMTEHRPGSTGSPELNSIRQFEQYDDKINVDDFSLIHDGIRDHLFLLQGFRLQKNNPGKETFSGGVSPFAYTINYTYTYKSDDTPITKTGDLLYTAGPDAGKRFQINSLYSYY